MWRVARDIVAGLAIIVAGCDRNAVTPSPVAPPAAQTSEVPATMPSADVADAPDTQPTGTILAVDGRLYPFPRGMLRLRTSDGKVSALLYTDDPAQAIKDDYAGNSFYLPMNLDIASADEIGTAHWVFHADSSDRDDSPNGIFLHGHSIQLQPVDVDVQFSGGASAPTMDIRGRFLETHERPEDNGATPQFVVVLGSNIPLTPAK
jgi:hypothetical protein